MITQEELKSILIAVLNQNFTIEEAANKITEGFKNESNN